MMPKMLKKNFLNPKTVWEVFLSHDLAEAEVCRGRCGETPKRHVTDSIGNDFVQILTEKRPE